MMKERWAIVLLLVGLLVLGAKTAPMAGAADKTGANQGPARTEIRYFLPFSGDAIHPSLKISRDTTGDCDERSIVVTSRPDAWFCHEDNGSILDPCFQDPMGALQGPVKLVCADSPESNEVIEFTTTHSLPSPADSTPPAPGPAQLATPWALELANGKHCELMRGATAGIAGMRINLACTGGGYIFGDLDTTGAVWYANYYDQSEPSSTQVAVVSVWT